MPASALHRIGFAAALAGFVSGTGAAALAQSYQQQRYYYQQQPQRYQQPSQRYQQQQPSRTYQPPQTRSVPPQQQQQRIMPQTSPSPPPSVRQVSPPEQRTPQPQTTPAQTPTPSQPQPPVPQQAAPRPAPVPAAAAPVAAGTPAENSARCMNIERNLPADTVVASCGATIRDTVKNLATAYYLRGVALRSKRDFDGAVADFNQAISLDPSDSEYLIERGNTHDARGDLDRAIADHSAAIKVNPNSANAFNSRGAALQRKGDYARAAADYAQVTKLQPKSPEAWSALCWARAIGERDLQQALQACNEALRIKPDAIDALDSRGFVQLKLNRIDAAIADYDAALKIDPKYAPSLYARGIARQRKGDRGGSADVAAAQKIAAGIADELGRYGLR